MMYIHGSILKYIDVYGWCVHTTKYIDVHVHIFLKGIKIPVFCVRSESNKKKLAVVVFVVVVVVDVCCF